jgi:lysophospholipase
MLSHSMGGAVALRALTDGFQVRAAAFSAPMWGIAMKRRLRPVAWGVSGASRALGLSHRLAPGQDLRPYLLRAAFEDNGLTGDRATWDRLRAEIEAEPDLALGGPSLRWLHEALREMRRLMALPAPDVPSLVLLGEHEAVVDPTRVHNRLRGWPAARLLVLEGARHEVLMEAPAIRERALDAVAEHFAGSG